MPVDNQPWVYQLCMFHKRLLSMDSHHEMLLALWQKPDVEDVSEMRVLPLKTTKESHRVAMLHNCDKIRLFAVEI